MLTRQLPEGAVAAGEAAAGVVVAAAEEAAAAGEAAAGVAQVLHLAVPPLDGV